jgi:hypothetical protein
MGSAATKWFCVPLLLGALAIAGCVAVPVPVASPSDPPLAGRRIKPEDVTFIQPGMTSRDEVISNLGVPTVDLSDLRVLVYVWIEYRGQWVGAIPGLLFTAPRTAEWALLVAIDENNRVVRSGFDERRGSETVISQAPTWAEAQQVSLPPVRTSFDPLPIPEEKAVIYIYRVKPPFVGPSSWLFPVGVAIDNQYVTEMHDATYAAVPVSAGRHEIVADPLPPYRWVPDEGSLGKRSFKETPGYHHSRSFAGAAVFPRNTLCS